MRELGTGQYLGKNKKSYHVSGLVISETEYLSKVYEGWHAHENFHLSFILQGGNKEKRKSTELEATAGTLTCYQCGELHRNYHTKHPSRTINLEIRNEFFTGYAFNFPGYIHGLQDSADAKFTMLKIYKECKMNDGLSVINIHTLLLNLLTSPFNKPVYSYKPGWIDRLREFLNDRWNENLPLKEIAAEMNVHPVTVSKFFPKYFHGTLGEYIRKKRIEKAITLVKDSRLSLTEIAYTCGFFDQSHFTRNFKELTGFLPNAYKKL